MLNSFKISKFLLYFVPLMVVIVTSQSLFPFIVGKYVYFRTLVDLAFIFFLLGILFNQSGAEEVINRLKKLAKNPLVIAISAFAVFFLLACAFGVDPLNSFWSNFERGEGGLQIIHFYIFFGLLALLFGEEKDWHKIFSMMILGGLGMAFYGLMAGWGNSGYIGFKFGTPDYRFYGSIGNPAYTAAYAIFMIFYIGYLLFSKYMGRLFSSWGAWLLWILAAIFMAVFLGAATRGAFIGLIAATLAFAAYLAFSSKRWRKWIILAAAVLVVLVLVLIQFKDAPIIKASPISRLLDISLSTETFKDRTIIWKMAIDGFKERPIFGWGPENFLQVFDRHFNTEYYNPPAAFGAWFDRAHDIYLDYLVETGILGLLGYLAIYAAFYWLLFKNARINTDERWIYTDKKNHDDKKSVSISQNPRRSVLLINALMFAIPVAYLVQGIVLFDVSPIYLNLFLIFAFATYKFNTNSQNV